MGKLIPWDVCLAASLSSLSLILLIYIAATGETPW
jgi:hypothetical protein